MSCTATRESPCCAVGGSLQYMKLWPVLCRFPLLKLPFYGCAFRVYAICEHLCVVYTNRDKSLSTDTVLDTVPLYRQLGTDSESTASFSSFRVLAREELARAPGNTNSDRVVSPPTHPPPSLSSSSSPAFSPVNMPATIIPLAVTNRLLQAVAREEPGSAEPPTDQALHLLLLATLESVATQTSARATAQVRSTVHLLAGLTALFEDMVALWLQLHNQSDIASSLLRSADRERDVGLAVSSGESSYQGVVHVARAVLRLWLALSSQVLCSNITTQQATEIKPLLSSPVLTISKACYNLRRVGLFCGNECLDHEFTLMLLETVLACLHSANLLALIVTCPGEDIIEVFQDCLSDGCHEWFTYLCSKLHAVTEADSTHLQTSGWCRVMEYSYALLAVILRELIQTAEHIKLFQRASKSALSGEISLRPITYTVTLSRNFDKLTIRMSKLANIVLDCFKQVSTLQLLSLQLLSETANDTIEIISNFLSNILDPAIRANSEVLDQYLELLENVWFRLSPDYSSSPTLWKKLSNYFTLLHDANRGTLHQVLYHLQCLFSHESITLKSQLTQHVVLPLHTHLIAKVREKVYSNHASSGSGACHIGRADVEWTADLENTLGEDEKTLIILFLKLLLKVVSHPNSLQSFLTDTKHLYSLFLLLPIPSFCPPTLAVAEQCLKTLQKSASSSGSGRGGDTSRAGSGRDGDTSRTGSGREGDTSRTGSGREGDTSRTGSGREGDTSRTGSGREVDTSGTQKTLLKIFLTFGFSMPVDRIMDLCLAIADGKISLPTFGIGEVDRVHKRLQDTFETPPLSSLLSPSFLNHLSIISNVWEILARLAPHGPLVLTILRENYVWDVVADFSPILGSLLTRIQQQIEGETLEAGDVNVCLLQELAVSLLSNLMSMAHFLCWQRKEAKVWVHIYNYNVHVYIWKYMCLAH